MRINGELLLSKPYKVDFTNGKYSIWYGGLLRNVGVGNKNESIGISTRTYMKHKFLWLFDMTPDNCNRRGLHVDYRRDIAVEVSFYTPSKNYNVDLVEWNIWWRHY